MSSNGLRPFTAATSKLAYAQAFTAASVRTPDGDAPRERSQRRRLFPAVRGGLRHRTAA